MSKREKRREARSGRARSGLPDWACLYGELYVEVRSWLVARVANDTDAEDLAQQVFAELTRAGYARRPQNVRRRYRLKSAGTIPASEGERAGGPPQAPRRGSHGWCCRTDSWSRGGIKRGGIQRGGSREDEGGDGRIAAGGFGVAPIEVWAGLARQADSGEGGLLHRGGQEEAPADHPVGFDASAALRRRSRKNRTNEGILSRA